MGSLMTETLRGLDAAKHNQACVCAVAVMGEDGFEFASDSNIQTLDAEAGIRMLLEGFAMMGAASLAEVMGQAYAEIAAERDPPEDDRERFIAMRQAYELAIRRWWGASMRYAAEKFQADHGSDMSVAAGSQILGLFMNMATAPIAYKATEDQPDA